MGWNRGGVQGNYLYLALRAKISTNTSKSAAMVVLKF
jgi:hypothetical protein